MFNVLDMHNKYTVRIFIVSLYKIVGGGGGGGVRWWGGWMLDTLRGYVGGRKYVGGGRGGKLGRGGGGWGC